MYYIDSNMITQVTTCKYLGLWIDQHLSLNIHIQKVQNKSTTPLPPLFSPNSGLKLFPKTISKFIPNRPCIEYAHILLHFDKNHKINTLQNKFIRAISM